MENIFERLYKPDVLSCLADLSNDEVFTPPEVANKMLDLLPQELFQNKETKILDPACKSGVFLREAAKRFIDGERDQFDTLEECLDWIFKNQLYGIAITELTSLLSRRSLYCSKYPASPFSVVNFGKENVQGNILYHRISHSWIGVGNDKKCAYCGTNFMGDFSDEARAGLETHAYEWIHTDKPEDIFNMKFDVIISNPPYQLTTGGGLEGTKAATQAKPLYNMFVTQAKKLNPRYITMIIPARWYAGGIGLNEFRQTMINDQHIVKLVDYANSKDCFPGVDIAGGVCYFLWDRDSKSKECEITNILGDSMTKMDRPLNEFGDFFMRSNISMELIAKVRSKSNHFMNEMVSSLDTFGLPTQERGHEIKKTGDIVLLHSVGSNKQGKSFIERSKVKKNVELIDKYKVKISRMIPQNGEVGIDPAKGYRSIAGPYILKPGEVDTFSYLNIGFFDTEEEAENFLYYIQCKFPRYMLRTTYSGVNVSQSNFVFVPIMDFKKKWTDQELYQYFNLSDKEIELIEKTMRPMNSSGGDD